MEVVINSLCGHICNIFAEDSWTVDDLKVIIRGHTGVPKLEQSLIMGTSCLDDREVMSNVRSCSEGEILSITMIRLSTEMAAWIHRLKRSCHYSVFRSAPEHIQNSWEVVFTAVCGDANVLNFASETFRKDRKIVAAAIKKDAAIFQDLPEEVLADREITLLAVRGDGRNLEYASKQLHADPEVVDAAINTYAAALFLCPQVLWDAHLVLKAVNTSKKNRASEHSSFLQHVQLKAVFGQKDFLTLAVEEDPLSLQFATEHLKADREVVTRAVEMDWQALEHAANELKSDRKLVSMAMAQNPRALKLAGSELKNDFDFVLEAVKLDHEAFTYASRKLQQDEVITSAAWYTKLQAQR